MWVAKYLYSSFFEWLRRSTSEVKMTFFLKKQSWQLTGTTRMKIHKCLFNGQPCPSAHIYRHITGIFLLHNLYYKSEYTIIGNMYTGISIKQA